MVTEEFTLVKKKLILQSNQLSWYMLSNESTRITIDAVKLHKLPASQVNK